MVEKSARSAVSEQLRLAIPHASVAIPAIALTVLVPSVMSSAVSDLRHLDDVCHVSDVDRVRVDAALGEPEVPSMPAMSFVSVTHLLAPFFKRNPFRGCQVRLLLVPVPGSCTEADFRQVAFFRRCVNLFQAPRSAPFFRRGTLRASRTSRTRFPRQESRSRRRTTPDPFRTS